MPNPDKANTPSPTPPPLLARRLGQAGMLPFVLLAALLWMVRGDVQGFVAIVLAVYGAVVASFLGGVHWGIAARLPPEQAKFHWWWGVAPSLMGWVAAVMPAHARLLLLGLILLVCYWVDRRSYPSVGWADWLPMRLQLTVVAVLSCLLGAATA